MPQRYEETDSSDDEVAVSATVEESIQVEYSEQPFGPSTVIAALDQIEILVDLARVVPLSANVVLNKAEILDLVRQAKEALPDDLVAANAVVSDADAVLIRADSAAEAAVAEAGAKATSVLDDARAKADTVLAEAQDEANRTVARANEEAQRTGQRASQEAERMLTEARDQMEAMVSADNVTQIARQRAQEMVAEAKAETTKLREGANEYVISTLGHVSGVLGDLQRRTEAGLKKVTRQERTEAANIELD